MSIATKRGDSGQTGLVGDVRLSKADQRVEAYRYTPQPESADFQDPFYSTVYR